MIPFQNGETWMTTFHSDDYPSTIGVEESWKDIGFDITKSPDTRAEKHKEEYQHIVDVNMKYTKTSEQDAMAVKLGHDQRKLLMGDHSCVS